MWWKNWLPFHNGKNISGSKRTGNNLLGMPQINVLELQAAFLAIKALLPKIDKPHVQFAIDNRTAVTYMNKIRWNPLTSTFTLSNRTMAFCSENEPNSVSSLCAGNKNCIADRRSRVFNDSQEWMLNLQMCQQILLKMHGLEVDLFASRINHQLTASVSWRPQPGAMACHVFNLNWGLMKVTFFHLFCLIHRCIKKIQLDQAECILITPVWKSRPWYPVILSLLVDRALLLPKDSKLLQLPGTDKVHPLCSQKNFRLAAWPLSGKKYQNRGFLRRCQRYCRPHGDKKLPVSMKVPGRHGVAGVIRDKLILFKHL